MFEEHRIDPRERLELPLRLGDGHSAVTRDISANGMFFEIDGRHLIGGLVDFEMHLPDMRMKFTAVGRIVRLEHRDDKTGVAVRLMSPRLQFLE